MESAGKHEESEQGLPSVSLNPRVRPVKGRRGSDDGDAAELIVEGAGFRLRLGAELVP